MLLIYSVCLQAAAIGSNQEATLDGRGRKLVFDKWVKSGTGFYGLSGLWTLVVIEAARVWMRPG